MKNLTIKTVPDFFTKSHAYETVNPTKQDLENNVEALINYRKGLMDYLVNSKVGDNIGKTEWGKPKKHNTQKNFILNHVKYLSVKDEMLRIESEILNISQLIS